MNTTGNTSLMVVSARPLPPGVTDLLARFPSARWGHLHPVDNPPGRAHRLTTRGLGSGPRALALTLAGALSGTGRKMVLAAKSDSWFRTAARSSATIVALDQTAEAALPIAHHFHPAATLAGPGRDLTPLHALCDHALRAEDFALVLELLDSAGHFGENADCPVCAGYRTMSELTVSGATSANVGAVTTGVFAAADAALAANDVDRAATLAALGLDVLFHRELHSDAESSPLVDDPARYLGPLRDSRVGSLLAGPVPGKRPRLAPSEQLRIALTPGPFSTFHLWLAGALGELANTSVEVLDLRDKKRGFTTMKMDPVIVSERLRAALDLAPAAFATTRAEFLGADIVVADWADKIAVLAALSTPTSTRLVVRLHSVDLLRPWLHLIDWSRVAAITCLTEAMATLARELIGEPGAHVPIHVIGNEADVIGLDQPKTPGAERTLAMIGWAQRVKDPLWALDVLERLLATDSTWRLVLIGAGFPRRPTASGRAYADQFRARAAEPGLRDRITYTGYSQDVPSQLREVGFILSASRRESFHRALLEGALSGAVPVVRDWPIFARVGAAASVYPAEWIVTDPSEAAARITAHADHAAWLDEAEHARSVARKRTDLPDLTRSHQRAVLGDRAYLEALLDKVTPEADDEARTVIADMLANPAAEVASLRAVARACAALGEMTSRAAAFDRLNQLRPSPRAERSLQLQLGRIQETSPEWEPTVTGTTEAYTPVPGRVLHVLKVSKPHRQSGYTMRGAYTLMAQARAGIDPVAVTFLDFPEEAETGVGGPELVDGIAHHRLLRDQIPEVEGADAYLDAWASALARTVAEVKPAILHAHSGHHGFEGVLATLVVGRAFNIPVVYEVRGFFESVWKAEPHRRERGETYDRRFATETRCMRQAAAVVTLSESMKADIVARGIDPAKVFVVPNGIDPAAFPVRPRSDELRAQWDLEDTFVIGYVSNLDSPREGHELLMEAALGLRSRGIPATALIVGDGRRRDELEQIAEDLGAGDAVIFTGQVPHVQVQDYYRLCDVFVVPRTYERVANLVTPLKPYEAMALQVPLVVSDLDALREVIGHGDRGASFPAGDAHGLTQVLTWAHDHPADMAARAARAREWVVAERTWDTNAAIYRRVYDSLMAHHD